MRIRAAATVAFQRYRDHGDVVALGEVFDLTAQELLLVAVHLARRGVEAEDLVQLTFVTAIARAATWDGRRPVEPWLVGILGNLARNAQRRAQRERRHEVALDADVGAVAAGGEDERDPQDRAALSESAVAIRTALRTMPGPVREVLTLHLVHGMTPTEIAHAIGRPVGTVKSQVHRGLQALRTRLPAGLATLLTMSLSLGEALAAVRIAVLTTAAAGGGRVLPVVVALPSTSAAGPAFAWWWVLAVVPAVAFVLWSRRGDVDRGAPTAGEVGVEARSAVTDAAASPAAPPATERLPAARAVTGELLVRVTVVGQPLPHAVCWLEPTRSSDPRLRRRQAVADEQGVARFADLPASEHRLGVDRGQPRIVQLGAGTTSVDLQLPPGVSMTGTVMDGSGQRCAGARIWMSGADAVTDGLVVGTADADGRFDLAHVPPDRFVAAFVAGWQPSRPVVVPAGDGVVEAALVVDLPATGLTITVVDAESAPVAGALVQVGAAPAALVQRGPRECRWRPPWQEWTDRDGRVHCASAPAEANVPVFARLAACAGTAILHGSGPAGGTTGVTLALPRSAACAGRVLAPGTDAAAIEVVALVGRAPTPGTLSPGWLQPQTRCDHDGSYALAGLATGGVAVRAAVGAQFAEAELDLAAGASATWSPRLGAGVGLLVQVEGLGAATMPGLEVLADSPYGSHRAAVAADGRAQFVALGERPFDLVLRVVEAEGTMVLARAVRVTPGGSSRLLVPAAHRPSAWVRGRCHSTGRRLPTCVTAMHASLGERQAPCAADGTFVIGPLPPGAYDLLAADTFHLGHVTVELSASATVDVGEFRCSDPLVLPIRLADGSTGSGHVYVRPRGKATLLTLCALTEGHGELWSMPGRFEALVADAEGVFLPQPLELPPDGGSVRLAGRAPGASLVRLQAELASGAGEADVIWRLTCGNDALVQRTWRRDLRPGGIISWNAWLPPGMWHVLAVDRFGERAAWSFRVGAGQTVTVPGVVLR